MLPDGERPAAVCVRDGRIAAVLGYDAEVGDGPVEDLGDVALLPGLVDTHVHVNEPGRTEWEGFATATRAAAAGGVTTIIDMPLNSIPPTVSVDGAARPSGRRPPGSAMWTSASGAGRCPATRPTCRRCTRPASSGSSAFLIDSGVAEFPPLSPAGLGAALAAVRRAVRRARRGPGAGADRGAAVPRYADFLASRPPAAEERAVGAGASRRPGGPAPACTSCTCRRPTALPLIAAARARRAYG